MQLHRSFIAAGRSVLLLALLGLGACAGEKERTPGRPRMETTPADTAAATAVKHQMDSTVVDSASRPVPAADTVVTAQTGFNGRWGWTGNDGASFELRLQETDSTTISGFHCAITANARRVDCAANDSERDAATPTILGTISGHTATVTFRSLFGIDKKGKRVMGNARIINRGDSLDWRIEGQATGEHWLPFAVTLKRLTIDD